MRISRNKVIGVIMATQVADRLWTDPVPSRAAPRLPIAAEAPEPRFERHGYAPSGRPRGFAAGAAAAFTLLIAAPLIMMHAGHHGHHHHHLTMVDMRELRLPPPP